MPKTVFTVLAARMTGFASLSRRDSTGNLLNAELFSIQFCKTQNGTCPDDQSGFGKENDLCTISKP